MMADCEEDKIIRGPSIEYVAQYSSVGKFIYDQLKADPAFIGQIEAHTGHKYSYAEILDRSIRLALWFRDMEIRPGDVVSYVTSNHRDVIIVVYATFFVGAVLTPWDPLLSTQEIAYFMGHTKPKIVICSKEAVIAVQTATEELHVTPIIVVHGESSGAIPFEDTQVHSQPEIDSFQCTEVAENDVLLLVCTSGTSALPKIIQRTNKSVLISTQIMKIRPVMGNVFITSSPLSWLTGLHSTLIGPTKNLQHVVASYSDDKLLCKWIEEYQVNFAYMTTPMCLRMIYSDAMLNHDISSLQMVVAGGALLREWHYKKFEESAPVGCKLLSGYGITEAAGGISRTTGANNPGSCGNLAPGENDNAVSQLHHLALGFRGSEQSECVDTFILTKNNYDTTLTIKLSFFFEGVSTKIVDPHTGKTMSPYELGELCVKTANMFAGYYNDPALTRSVIDADGWFHTGDLAKFDINGELYIIDRLKDVINVNGVKVSPAELEAILANHPGVDSVGVVGKKVSFNVEHPVAFVVKTPGSNVTEEELCNFLKARVKTDAKQLRGGVRFIHEMPRSTSQKVKRWELRKMLEFETQ